MRAGKLRVEHPPVGADAGIADEAFFGISFGHIFPDSPDEISFGQLPAPISIVKSGSYAESSSRILTDPTGERRNWQFFQRFRGLRSCRPNPSGESGILRQT